MEKIVIFIKKLRNFFVIKINSVLNFIESEYMLKKYKLETTKIDLVFDIGYNFGNFSKALLRNNKNLKIIELMQILKCSTYPTITKIL